MADLPDDIAPPFHHAKNPQDVSDEYLIAVSKRFVNHNIWEPDGDFIEELLRRFETMRSQDND